MKIEIHLCLTFHLTLQNICQQGGDIYCLSQRTIQCFSTVFQFLLPVHLLKHLALHTGRCDLHHVNLRTDVCKDSLNMCQSSGKHRQTVRHCNLVLLHDLHQILHNLCNINIAKIFRTVFGHQIAYIFKQFALIRLPTEFSDCQNSILDHTDIIQRNTFNGPSDFFPVMLRQTAHHSHINPDDLAVPHTKITRMRIGMEKAIYHNLLNKIINELTADLIQIIAVFLKILLIINGKAIDILHHNNMRSCILPI